MQRFRGRPIAPWIPAPGKDHGPGRIRGKQYVGSNAGSNFRTVLYTFPIPFSVIPQVIASAKNDPSWNVNDSFSITVRSVSTTQVTFNIVRVDSNGGWNQNMRINWMAWE